MKSHTRGKNSHARQRQLIMKTNNRYSFKHHIVIPNEIRNVKSNIENGSQLKQQMVSDCKSKQKATYHKNIRHHFLFSKDMGVSAVVEIIDNWKLDFPSKYFIQRTFNSKNKSITEISELYKCRDCEEYCWSNNRVVYPYGLFVSTIGDVEPI